MEIEKTYSDDDTLQQVVNTSQVQNQKYDIDSGLQLNIKPLFKELKLSSTQPQNIPCLLQLSTKEDTKDDIQSNRPGIDIICVIDKSGSMHGNPLNLVKDTLLYILTLLNENDRLCLIEFDHNSKRLCPLTKVSSSNLSNLESIINSLQTGGSTDINKGMNQAFEVLRQRRQQNQVTSIFLLSDGQDKGANLKIEQSLKSYNFQDSFTINTFGFGSNHDAELMSNISMYRDGNFYYIENINLVYECFVDALGGLFSVVGEQIELDMSLKQVPEFLNGLKICKTYGEMWKKDSTDINNPLYKINIKQLISGISKEYVFEIQVPQTSITQTNIQTEIIQASVKITPVGSNKIVQKQTTLEINFFNENQEVKTSDDQEVIVNFLRVQGADALEKAMLKAQQGDYETGQSIIQKTIIQIENSGQEAQSKLLGLLKDLKQSKESCKSTSYQSKGQLIMTSQIHSHICQTSNSAQNCYQNSQMKLLSSSIPKSNINFTEYKSRTTNLNYQLPSTGLSIIQEKVDIKKSTFKGLGIGAQNIDDIQSFKMVDQKYIIKNHKLGKGSFAETYLACLKGDSQSILAAKMISRQSLKDKLKFEKNPDAKAEYMINCIKNEVQLWKSVENPNIVKFYAFSETPNNIYFFIEYCNDGDLEKLMKQNGAFDEVQALEYFRQISNGLKELYEKKVYHRDIKPENILLSDGICKLADFGFSKIVQQNNNEQKALGTAVGTPKYMCPQMLGGEEYSLKCDVWSCGVMFYQMLYNRFPWDENNSIVGLYNKIKKDQVIFPSMPNVSQKTKELIRKMLEVDEDKRYSIVEVTQHLEKIKK